MDNDFISFFAKNSFWLRCLTKKLVVGENNISASKMLIIFFKAMLNNKRKLVAIASKSKKERLL